MIIPLIMRRLEMKGQSVLMMNCLSLFQTVGRGANCKIVAARKSREDARPNTLIAGAFFPLLKNVIKSPGLSILAWHYGLMTLLRAGMMAPSICGMVTL